jgi:hypothetical protein
MSILKKNLPSPTNAALFALGLCTLGILTFCSYEMIVIFIDTLAEKASSVNNGIMTAGMAGN